MIRRITTPAVPEPPPGSYTNCLQVGDTLHLSGQHAGGPDGRVVGDGTVLDQTRRALHKLIALIEAAGGGAADIVKLTIYLTDMSRRAEVSEARREVLTGTLPCSTLIGVTALAFPGLLVEVDATVALHAGGRPA